MKKLAILGIGAVVLLSMSIPVSAQVLEGSFSGRADHSGGVPGSYTVGESYTAYQTLNTTQQNPWYPWNQGAFEYTLVITTSVTSFSSGSTEDVGFADAAVAIYEDAGTPADFANTATFTDGTLILSGTITNMAGSRINSFGFPYGVTGDLTLDGGAGLANLDPQCAGGNMVLNDFINFQIGTWPDALGYEEAYDSKFDCPDVTGTEDSSWGRIKSQYE